MNIENVKFGLRKVSNPEFASFDDVEIEDLKIGINLNFGFGINQDSKILGCEANFTFLSSNAPFLKLKVKCDFAIEPSSWQGFINEENKSICFPLNLIHHLATITVGTARGILYAKTENTKFNKYFIPTLDITQSLKKDIQIQLT